MQQESNTNSLSCPPPSLSQLRSTSLAHFLATCSSIAVLLHRPLDTLSLSLSFQFPAENPLFPLFLSIKIAVSGCLLIFASVFFPPLPLFLSSSLPIWQNISLLWNCFVLSTALHHLKIEFASLMWCLLSRYIFSKLHFSLSILLSCGHFCCTSTWVWLLLITKDPKCNRLKNYVALLSIPVKKHGTRHMYSLTTN